MGMNLLQRFTTILSISVLPMFILRNLTIFKYNELAVGGSDEYLLTGTLIPFLNYR